jgi:DNA-binding LytR/AlgR family response regulator
MRSPAVLPKANLKANKETTPVKVLIASPDLESSRHLNSTFGKVAPAATYFHADSAERVLDLFSNHRLDVVLLDLRLVAKSSAASALLQLLHPGGMTVTAPDPESKHPRVLLTYDGSIEWAGAVISRLLGQEECSAATPEKTLENGNSTIWAQEEEGGDWRSIDVKELMWAVAEGGRVKLHHATAGVCSVRDPLRELERQLGRPQFVRIHKSYLVNSDYVSEVQRWSSGGLLIDIEGTRLPVSRRFVNNFRQRTGWGVGPVHPRAKTG